VAARPSREPQHRKDLDRTYRASVEAGKRTPAVLPGKRVQAQAAARSMLWLR
jgi:hypothetical protein